MLNDIDLHTVHLVQQAQQGDEDSFSALYQRYGTTVLRTAYLILADMSLAEDVVQDVFVQIYRHLDGYQLERGAFGAWIYRITVNTCLRVRQRWRFWLPLSDHLHHPSMCSTAASPLEVALMSDEQREIWQAVQQLSLKLRIVVVLRYYHDVSYAEIAEILQCPIGTVRSRLNAAHSQLQKLLGGDIL